MEKRRKRESGGGSAALMSDMRGFGAASAGLTGAGLLGSALHDWSASMMSSSSSSYLPSPGAYHHHSVGSSPGSSSSYLGAGPGSHHPHPAAAASSSYLPPYSSAYHSSYHSSNMISDSHHHHHHQHPSLIPELQSAESVNGDIPSMAAVFQTLSQMQKEMHEFHVSMLDIQERVSILEKQLSSKLDKSEKSSSQDPFNSYFKPESTDSREQALQLQQQQQQPNFATQDLCAQDMRVQDVRVADSRGSEDETQFNPSLPQDMRVNAPNTTDNQPQDLQVAAPGSEMNLSEAIPTSEEPSVPTQHDSMDFFGQSRGDGAFSDPPKDSGFSQTDGSLAGEYIIMENSGRESNLQDEIRKSVGTNETNFHQHTPSETQSSMATETFGSSLGDAVNEGVRPSSGKKRKRKSDFPRKSTAEGTGVDAPAETSKGQGRDMSDLINMLETATEDELPNWCPISMEGQCQDSEPARESKSQTPASNVLSPSDVGETKPRHHHHHHHHHKHHKHHKSGSGSSSPRGRPRSSSSSSSSPATSYVSQIVTTDSNGCGDAPVVPKLKISLPSVNSSAKNRDDVKSPKKPSSSSSPEKKDLDIAEIKDDKDRKDKSISPRKEKEKGEKNSKHKLVKNEGKKEESSRKESSKKESARKECAKRENPKRDGPKKPTSDGTGDADEDENKPSPPTKKKPRKTPRAKDNETDKEGEPKPVRKSEKPAAGKAGFYLPTFSDSDDDEEGNGAGLIIDLGGVISGGKDDDIADDVHEEDPGGNSDGPCRLDDSGVAVFVCVHCDRTFESRQTRRKHIAADHADVVANAANDEDGKTDCDVCGKSFATRATLAVHKKSVHFKVRWPCPECGFQFSNKAHLNRHVQGVHLKIQYQCEHCDKKFTRKDRLNEHIRFAHPSVGMPPPTL